MSVQKENDETKVKKNQYIKILAIFLLPLILAGLYIIVVQFGSIFRYDQAFFGEQFQETYASPGAVARALEGALQNGDEQLYAELSGLNQTPADLAPRPELHYSILVDVDERDYFHYLYFDMGTMRRDTHYVKEVNGRWVTVPQDAYFYLDSGQWMKVFMPVSVSWWGLLLAIAIMKMLARVGSRSRAAFGW
jgi:hypothetical protein